MKKRILCLVLVFAMLLPIQVFAASLGTKEVSSSKIVSNSITASMYVTRYVTYYSADDVEGSIYVTYNSGGRVFSGYIDLESVTKNGSKWKAKYSGNIYSEIS